MKKTIVISAINLREGGTLSILQDVLSYLNSNLIDKYRIIALVHNKNLVPECNNIEFLEFPNSIRSYFLRVYYEYFYFKKLSRKLKPYLWLSLHDMTPNVEASVRAVYCHNSTPFYNTKLSDFFKDPKVFLFSIFYKYLYACNIKKNDYVIVQQQWIGTEFKSMYSIDNIVVSKPQVPKISIEIDDQEVKASKYTFFYPSFPRSFKNFEVVCEAAKILNKKCIFEFEVILTINGCENRYSKRILKKYKGVDSISFVGILPREEVFKYYSMADTLIFPSKLETWGLPISEFQGTHKPLLVADLPYAYETVGDYEKVTFFDPHSAEQLARLMQKSIEDKITYSGNKLKKSNDVHAKNWGELFSVLLN